jgi:hypothetical protein
MAFYDSGATYDSGLLYGEDLPVGRGKMVQLKLELQNKTDAELKAYSLNHINKMNGNAAFPTPVPAATVVQAKHDAFSTALTGLDGLLAACSQGTATKDAARAELIMALTQRARNIEGTPGLTEAQALSTGFEVRSGRTPVGDLPAPQNLAASGGDQPGEVDCQWEPVRGRSTYLAEWAASVAGPWTQGYAGSKSKCTFTGLAAGALLYFRVRAVGANGPGPWSDIAEKRAS